MPVLNLLVSVWILLNGSLFGPTQVDGILNILTHVSGEVFLFPFQALFQSLGLVFVSKSTHYRTMSNIIYPVVWLFWQLHQSEVIQECLVRKGNVFQKSSFFLQYPSCPLPPHLENDQTFTDFFAHPSPSYELNFQSQDFMQRGSALNLAGDGRFDSPGKLLHFIEQTQWKIVSCYFVLPGFSAATCTYYLQVYSEPFYGSRSKKYDGKKFVLQTKGGWSARTKRINPCRAASGLF